MALYQSETSKQAELDALAAPGVFWGHSSGGLENLAIAETCLREGNLSAKQLHDLRTELPIGASGTTTGQRIARIDRVLKRLEKEASH